MRIWYLACFSVIDHIRSGKLIVEAMLLAVFLGFFWSHPRRMMREDFFLTSGLFLILLAGMESYQLLARATDRRFHLVLSHVAHRRDILWGLFLAVFFIVGTVMLGLILAGAFLTSTLRETSWGAYLGGAILLLLNLLTTVALCFLFSPFGMGGNLGWMALTLIVFGFSRNAFLIGPDAGLLGWLAGLVHVLLPPFYEAINASEGHFEIASPILVGLHQLLYGTVVLGLTLWYFQQRELESVD